MSLMGRAARCLSHDSFVLLGLSRWYSYNLPISTGHSRYLNQQGPTHPQNREINIEFEEDNPQVAIISSHKNVPILVHRAPLRPPHPHGRLKLLPHLRPTPTHQRHRRPLPSSNSVRGPAAVSAPQSEY